MKHLIVVPIVALAACVSQQSGQRAGQTPPQTVMAHAKPAPAADPDTAAQGLIDLDNMTFDCPRAGLNAAAREAAKAPSQGSYQFSYFKLVNDAHHAWYEVHFRSNHVDEPELRYCVSIYCQQGWDPAKTQVVVALMSDEPEKRGRNQASSCGMHAGTR